MNAEEFFEKEEKKEKRKKIFQLAAIPVFYLIYIPLLVLCWKSDCEYSFVLLFLLIIPGLYYLMIFKPDILFDIMYMFDSNVENAEPSEWFYMKNRIGAYMIMISGPVIALAMYLFELMK